MNGVLNLAEQVLVDRVLSNDAPLNGKNKTGISFALISSLFLILGFAFIFYAAFVWLQNNYPAEEAAIMMGGFAIFLAACNGLVAYGLLKYKRKKIKQMKNELIATIEEALEFSNEELADPIKENPKSSVLIASVAGFLAGERFL